jgi:hypothetical protein
LEEENRLLKMQLAAAQAALALCGKGQEADLLTMREELAALAALAVLVVLGLLSSLLRAYWFHHRGAIFPPDR